MCYAPQWPGTSYSITIPDLTAHAILAAGELPIVLLVLLFLFLKRLLLL